MIDFVNTLGNSVVIPTAFVQEEVYGFIKQYIVYQYNFVNEFQGSKIDKSFQGNDQQFKASIVVDVPGTQNVGIAVKIDLQKSGDWLYTRYFVVNSAALVSQGNNKRKYAEFMCERMQDLIDIEESVFVKSREYALNSDIL